MCLKDLLNSNPNLNIFKTIFPNENVDNKFGILYHYSHKNPLKPKFEKCRNIDETID